MYRSTCTSVLLNPCPITTLIFTSKTVEKPYVYGVGIPVHFALYERVIQNM